MIAFEIGHLDLVKTLIEAGADSINHRDKVTCCCTQHVYKGILSTVFILSLII